MRSCPISQREHTREPRRLMCKLTKVEHVDLSSAVAESSIRLTAAGVEQMRAAETAAPPLWASLQA